MPEVIISGRRMLLDEADLARMNDVPWTVNSGGYAVYVVYDGGEYSGVRILHREILGAADGMEVDHKNGDRLDNRRSNLRACTHAENMRNRKIHKNNSSGFKGVYFDASKPRSKPWRARITSNGKRYNLGLFETKELAKQAYDRSANDLHGEFANAG